MRLIDQRWGEKAHSSVSPPQIIARQLTALAPQNAQCIEIGDRLTVSAKEPHQLFAAASCLEVAARAGHLRDFSGLIQPLISKRWLQWSLSFLMKMSEEKDPLQAFSSAANNSLEMGYNAIFMGEGFNYKGENRELSRSKFLKVASDAFFAAQAMNLQVGLDISRFEAKDKDLLVSFFSHHNISCVFHARLEDTFGQQEGLLRDEKLLFGLNCLRKICPNRTTVVAHLIDEHFGNKRELAALIARLPANCQLSFCALGESPDQIFGPPHAIWEALRSQSIKGALPLIPIFNPGQSGWGGGLWPTLPTLEWNWLMQRSIREGFESVLALTPQLPYGKGFLHASLWIFGQTQWRSLSMEDLWETWQAGHQPHWTISQKAQQYLLQLSKSLQRLTARKTKGCDLYDIRALQAGIALLRLRISKMVSGGCLYDSAQLFLTDAHNLLIAALQKGVGAHQGTQYHALLQSLVQEGANEMGIWTELRGSGASAKMGWRNHPLFTPYRQSEAIAREGGYVE